jgi:hypothetical protein
MNVQEILQDADLLVKNSYPTALKIGWMNQAQKQIYKELPGVFSSPPPDLKADQLTFVPRLPAEYHELLSLGAAKRIAERVQDFKLAEQLEVRYQNLLLDAKKYTAPKLKSIVRSRAWN